MAKDIRPGDPESALKKEVITQPPEKQEVIVTPDVKQEKEVVVETAREAKESELETKEEAPVVDDVLSEGKAPVTTVKTETPAKPIDRLEEEIEDILEEDLKEMYLSMSPEKQQEFRIKGEETRSKIRELVSSAKINAKKIFSLIRVWLKVIPGVNRFFLEQEAKIKTDKILLVTEEERKRKQNETL